MLCVPALGDVAYAEGGAVEVGHYGVGSGSALELFQREVKVEAVKLQLSGAQVASGGADD